MAAATDDGGPAFPTTPVSHGYSPMTEGDGTGAQAGMTLRDWFAGLCMQGASASSHQTIDRRGAEIIAEESYIVADAMLKARCRHGD